MLRVFSFIIALAASSGFTSPAMADAMLLVHGYQGSGASWHRSGVIAALHDSGWGYGGHIQPINGTMVLRPTRFAQADKAVYTVDLPDEAPADIQMRWLASAIDRIKSVRPAGERFILAGHSAGGVVARLFVVRVPDRKVDVLLTIAAPHLGTELAELGDSLASSPAGFFAPMMGLSELNRGQALYRDLSRPRPGSLLYWLNAQAHPNIHYISLIRQNGMDDIVPPFSQDMNNVPALRGRSQTYQTVGGHYLQRSDGLAIAGALAQLDRPK